MTDAEPTPTARPPVTLLGPQRRPTLGGVVRRLGLQDAPIAAITAGWQDRESEGTELEEHLGGAAIRLRLWERWQSILEQDPELAEADRRRREVREEIQDLYLIGVAHAGAALVEMEQLRDRDPSLVQRAVTDAVEVLQALDTRHLARVAEIEESFYAATRPHERPSVAHHRAEVSAQLAQCEAVVIAGGHVAVLLDALHLFNVAPLLTERPVIAWSAGAMVLTDRVVLFNDRSTGEHTDPEVYARGLGLVHDVVALPAAHQRLTLADPDRVSALVRRFAPSACLPLDPGSRVALDGSYALPESTPVLARTGQITPLSEAREVAHD